MPQPARPKTPPKGFGVKQSEITKVTILDSENNNSEEEKILAEITKQKVKQNQQADNKPGEVVFDSNAIASLIQQSISTALNDADAKRDEALKKQQEAFEKQIEQIQSQQQEQLKQSAQALEQTKNQLSEQQETVKKFEGLFKLTGSQLPGEEKKSAMGHPYINTETTTDSDKCDGAFKECVDYIEEQFSRGQYISKQSITHNKITLYDYNKKGLDRFIIKNRNAVIESLEKWGKKQGWFKGGQLRTVSPPTSIKQAATTALDLQGAFLDTLSSIVRTTHRPGFIFWQFPQYSFDFGANKGTTIQVPRFNYLTSSDTLSDYLLSGKGTYTTLTTDRDNLSSSTVSVEVMEWGRGKQGASTAIRPVMIPAFVEFHSAYELISLLNRNLGYDYSKFEDKKLRSYWDATSLVVYNNANTIVTTPGAVTTGGNGTLTKLFLRKLYTHAHTNKFEMLPDETYLLVLNSYATEQFKNDLEDDWEAPSVADLMALLDILNPAYIPPEDTSRVNGYLGRFERFHVFESNAFGVGSAGSDGVQSETLGSSMGAKTTRTSYLAGAGTTGRGVSMPMEIRLEEGIDFQRANSWTWLSWEGFGALDVDPTGYSDSSQQLRVIEIHTLDTAV